MMHNIWKCLDPIIQVENRIVYSYKFRKVKDSNEKQKVKSNSQPNL